MIRKLFSTLSVLFLVSVSVIAGFGAVPAHAQANPIPDVDVFRPSVSERQDEWYRKMATCIQQGIQLACRQIIADQQRSTDLVRRGSTDVELRPRAAPPAVPGRVVEGAVVRQGEPGYDAIRHGNRAEIIQQATRDGQSPMTKAAGVLAKAGTPLLAAEVGIFGGALIADGVGNVMGFDAEGTVCRGTDSRTVQRLAGRDCSGFGEFAPNYVPDAEVHHTYEASTAGSTARFVGYAPWPRNADVACYSGRIGSRVAADGGRMSVTWTDANGQQQTAAIWNPSTSPANWGGRCTFDSGPLPATAPSNLHGTAIAPQNAGPINPRSFSINVYDPTTGETSTAQARSLNDGVSPDRSYRFRYINNSGNSITSMDGPSFREEDGRIGQIAVPADTPGLDIPSEVEIIEITEGPDGQPEEVPIYREQTTQEYQDWALEFDHCRDGNCFLEVVQGQENGSVLGLEAGVNFDGNWSQNVTDWSALSTPDGFMCIYGGSILPLSDCRGLVNEHSPAHQNIGAPNADPSTGVWSGYANAPTTQEMRDAARGAQLGKDLGAASAAQAGAAAQAGVEAMARDTPSSQGCNLGQVGWNPIAWVMVPVQCALEWAFVPRAAKVELSQETVAQSWDGTIVGNTMNQVGRVSEDLDVDGEDACSLDVTLFDGDFENDATVVDVCPGAWAERLPQVSRLFTAVVATVVSFIFMRKQIAGMVGYTEGQG